MTNESNEELKAQIEELEDRLSKMDMIEEKLTQYENLIKQKEGETK
jgi:cell shape-determining protein MreC